MSSSNTSANGSHTSATPVVGLEWSRLAAFELVPTASRARARDAIIQDQINSPGLVWQQVGALLQGALAREYASAE